METHFSPRKPLITMVIVLTLLSGVVHGVLDGRWSKQEDKVKIGLQLRDLPEQLGEWALVDESDLDEGASKMLRCYGSFKNMYVHGPTKTQVQIAVMYGPRGPMAVHKPEICYVSEGSKQARGRVVETVATGGVDHQFWSVQFEREDDPEARFDVWYGFSTGGTWLAAKRPRFWLTDDLFKIQISGPATKSSFSPCKSFLTELLPVLEQRIQ